MAALAEVSSLMMPSPEIEDLGSTSRKEEQLVKRRM
jgi:hypothetical protein